MGDSMRPEPLMLAGGAHIADFDAFHSGSFKSVAIDLF